MKPEQKRRPFKTTLGGSSCEKLTVYFAIFRWRISSHCLNYIQLTEIMETIKCSSKLNKIYFWNWLNLVTQRSTFSRREQINSKKHIEAMELTGKTIEHMDKFSNVKEMKNIFQQKKQLDKLKKWIKTKTYKQQIYLRQTMSHNVDFIGFLKDLKQFCGIKEK